MNEWHLFSIVILYLIIYNKFSDSFSLNKILVVVLQRIQVERLMTSVIALVITVDDNDDDDDDETFI